jgi:hypothetical protein
MKKLFLVLTVLTLSLSLSSCCWHHRGPHGPGHRGPCAAKKPCMSDGQEPCMVKKPCAANMEKLHQKPCNVDGEDTVTMPCNH